MTEEQFKAILVICALVVLVVTVDLADRHDRPDCAHPDAMVELEPGGYVCRQCEGGPYADDEPKQEGRD